MKELGNTSVLLTEADCQHLINAGLKVQDGVDIRDLYCYYYLPEWYDGTPLQVLRLIEDINRKNIINKVPSTPVKVSKAISPRPMNESTLLTMTMKVTERASTIPVQHEQAGSSEKTILTPSKSPSKSSKRCTPLLTIDTEKDVDSPMRTPARKRKIEAVISPQSACTTPATTSGRKSRRTSILQNYQTPEQDRMILMTPRTEPAPPHEKRFEPSEEERLNQELVDDVDDQDSGKCCAGTLEPIWNVLHRTSSHFQNVWEEVRDLSSSFAPIPDEDGELNILTDLVPHLAHDVPTNDLVYQSDDEPSSTCFRTRSSTLKDLDLVVEGDEEENTNTTTRARRQQKERRRLSASTWRLW